MPDVPQVPEGVRPVTGGHPSRVPISRAARETRKVLNFAAVAERRLRPRAVELPTAPCYPKLFVVGCGRSGTSWVQSILSRHPAVVTSQESHAYETIFDAVAGRDRTSVAAWTKVVHRHDIAERELRWVGLHWWCNRRDLLDDVSWALGADGLDAAEAADRVIRAVFDNYFIAHGGSAQSTLLEKTPGHLFYADHILRHFPEARVIEVVRDGRDVCVSMQMQALTVDWPPKTRQAQILAWVRAVRRGMELRADPALSPRVHLVRYEEMKAAPEQHIEELFDFAGLTADDAMIADVADRSDFRHNRNTGAGSHTRRGEVGDWRNHFTDADEALFREVAGETFEAAGYDY